MNRGDFFSAMHTLTDCTPEATQKWIDFAGECLDDELYAGFEPTGSRALDMERWMDALCAGFCEVRAKCGPEMAGKIAALSLIPLCIFPDEMLQAAECLCQGGTADTIADKISSGEIGEQQPFFSTPVHPLTERDCGPEVMIERRGVPYGWVRSRIEPGYILRDGTALLERERDESGCYKAGVGMDGVFLRINELYRPVYSDDGRLWAFRQVCPAPENYLATAEMSMEANYNQIDGIINNEAPKPSIRDALKQCQEEADQRQPKESPNTAHERER